MTAEIELARPRTASLPEKLEYARFLATSGLLPAQYREKPGNILWAQEYAEMLNLRPMAAITGIHVIEGKPSASAALMSALVRRAGHRLRVSGDDQKAVVEIVRHDDPDFVFRSEWTIERARKAELTGKGTWKKYPAAMLKARAISECARDACEEALLGMHYTPEELGAEVDAEGEPIRATVEDMRPADPDWASKPATAHERATGQPEPAAEVDWDAEIERARDDMDGLRGLWWRAKQDRPADIDLRERISNEMRDLAARTPKPAEPAETADDGVEDAEEVTDAPAEQRQHRHMHALWNKAEVSREERLAVTSHLIGDDITSSSQLKYAQADKIIGHLSAFGDDTAALKSAIVRWLGDYHGAYDDEPTAEPAEATS